MLSLDVLLQSDALAPCFTLLFSAVSALGTTVGFVVAGSVAHCSTLRPNAPTKNSKLNEDHRKRSPHRGHNFAEVEPPLWTHGRLKKKPALLDSLSPSLCIHIYRPDHTYASRKPCAKSTNPPIRTQQSINIATPDRRHRPQGLRYIINIFKRFSNTPNISHIC